MDIIGRNPTSTEGEYFVRSIWSWHPLAAIVTCAAPELVGDWKKWYYNDGYDLDAAKSIELANRVETALNDQSFIDEYFKVFGQHPE
jgi:hypothetical protein